MDKLDKILGKETDAKPPDTDAANLEDTDFQMDGEGLPAPEDKAHRKWYGKKERRSGLMKGKQQKERQKHRKFAKLKKLLNVGEKLKPIGLGTSGADYDGQTPARSQGEDDVHVPEADHVDQGRDQSSPAAVNLDHAEREYDLYVHVHDHDGFETTMLQVFGARDLTALDSDGFSDPYCKIHLGNSKQRTKTIHKSLDPQWEETFHFSAHELKQCMNKSAKLVFELRDKDFLSTDEFLGSVAIDLTKVQLRAGGMTVDWYRLKGSKHGELVESLGEIKLGIWLSNNVEEQEDQANNAMQRLKSEGGDRDKRLLSTLCPPRGMVKVLPIIVHTEGNCLYEEPCIYYLSLQVGEVRRLTDFAGDGVQYEDQSDFTDAAQTRKAKSDSHKDNKSISLDGTSTSWQMFMDQMEDSTGWQDEDGDEEASGAEDDSDGGGGPNDAEDGEDPFDNEEGNIENPLQAPDAEEEQGAAPGSPVKSKSLYVEASLGNQRRRSKLARLKNKKFSWNQGLPFATVLPVRDKHYKVILCERDSSNQESCPVAIAFVSLIRLLKEQSEEGKWYKLHDYAQSKEGKPRIFGAVRLKLRGTDSDGRRTLYHQPIFKAHEGFLDIPEGVATRVNGSANSQVDAAKQSSKDWAQGAHTGYEEDRSAHGGSGYRPPNAADRLESGLSSFHGREVHVGNSAGLSRRYRQSKRIALLAVQAILAITSILLRILFFWWQKVGQGGINLVRNLFPSGKVKRERKEPDDDVQLKPADLALGVAKFVLRTIELRDQPKGKYFCVFRCGPHWGQTRATRTKERIELNWEIHLPIMEPHTLFTLVVFRDMHRKETSNLRSRPPEMIGKLRLRLNTLQTGELYETNLPMLGDRKQGGHHNADAQLTIKTIYFFEKPVVQKYFQAIQPYDIYALKLGEGNVAKQLEFENKRLCLEWLEKADPNISKTVAKAVIGAERQQFVFSRAKANWTRFMMEKERFTWIIRFWKRNQAWENPLESLSLICSLITFAFHPQIVLVGILLLLAFYSFVAAQKRPDKPWQMVMDPDDDEDDEDEGEGGITQLRKKYFRLVKVALSVQNYLEDFADTLERLHAFINWADPKATLVFIFACLAAVLAIAAFSLPVVLAIGLCWTVRPPIIRSPTPPAPLSFFLRLPTRSDQII